MQCTKIKAKKNKNRFNQYILFPILPSQDQVNHSTAQKSGAGSLLINCPKCCNLCDCTIKYCKSQGNCACYFQSNTAFVSFTDSLYTVLCPVTCVHTQKGTHTDLKNLLNFTNKLQKGSGNTLQDGTELCQM